MVATSIVRLADAHRVVGEVDIAVIAWRTVNSSCLQNVTCNKVLTEELGHVGVSMIYIRNGRPWSNARRVGVTVRLLKFRCSKTRHRRSGLVSPPLCLGISYSKHVDGM